jgi:microsomal epoxide hydrolase
MAGARRARSAAAPQRLRRRLLQALGSTAALASGGAAAQSPAPNVQMRRTEILTSDGVRLSVIDTGAPAGAAGSAAAPAAAATNVSPAKTAAAVPAPAPTIVFVPGWCMPATIWNAQLAALGARWHTLALDPRGQGQSQIPATGYTADRRADDLHDLLAGYERVVLVGWSLGVPEALQYVYRYGSGRLAGLVLVDGSVGEPPSTGPTDFLDELRRNRATTLDNFVRAIFARPRPPEELRALRDGAMRMPLASSIALLSYTQPREHWREIARAFDRPLAYVITPQYREQARNLLAERPATRVEIFEQAGHALFVDEPDRFNRFLSEWITTL